MTFNDLVKKPSSKKITILETDVPLKMTWINYSSGRWFSRVTSGDQLVQDDNGNSGFWGNKNTKYFNIQSMNVNGELYTEVFDIPTWEITDKSWYYNSVTTDIYLHPENFKPPEYFIVTSPGAVLGFTKGSDRINNNIYEGIYYEPRLNSVPNIVKRKDPLFFGILQFPASSYSFDNRDGFFDGFASLALYGQPLRIKLSFEGLPLSESKLVYTGRVDDFSHDDIIFKLKGRDLRKLLSRKLPINTFDKISYPDIDDSLVGVPIPLIFGPVEKIPAYKTSSGNWTFADTTLLNIDSGITVTKEDDSIFSHSGTGTNGTFTGSDTDEQLYVTCSQTTKVNGLDVISFILENYENRPFNALNYDITEWNNEKTNVKNIGIWLGRENNLSSVKIIEQVCNDNNGIFDVLSDGRFTFRTRDIDRASSTTFLLDELLPSGKIPEVKYNSKELLSSVKIEYAKNWKTNVFRLHTNLDFDTEVFSRYRQRQEKPFKTFLTSLEDAIVLSDLIMETSKTIVNTLSLTTKTQKIELRILDNATYTYGRRDGTIIISESKYEILGVNLNMNSYKVTTTIRFLKKINGS